MKIDLSNVEKGPGVWIFNNSFLQDDCYVSNIIKIFADEIGSEVYELHPLIWWDNRKFKIKKISQIYGKGKYKEKNKEFYKLQNKIQEMSIRFAFGFNIDTNKYFEMKNELQEYEYENN